jgi:hypothetical protein
LGEMAAARPDCCICFIELAAVTRSGFNPLPTH